VKQREAEKLKALRESLAKQRANLDEIEKHIDQIESEAKATEGKKA
jgi:Mitochondrial ATPase inhibitor, IATP